MIASMIMTNLKRLPLLAVLTTLSLSCVSLVRAAPYESRNLTAGTGQVMSADTAAAIVRQATGGKVLRVEPSSQGYRVRVLLADGRVRVFIVDAATGRLSD